jgi:hypothetical protein
MTIRSSRAGGVALIVCLLGASLANAQSPWQVTVKPTLNPLPIGLCGAVHVDVRGVSGTDIPRNPLGARVTIADFDMTVTAPGVRAVVGQQIDPSHWSVCACGAARAGSIATITARYPAQSLPPASRVAGVAFQSTATFVIAPAKGTSPPPCLAPMPSNAPVVRAAPTTPTSTPTVVSSPVRASASQAATAAPGSQPVAPPPSLPSVPAIPQIPSFPVSTADWAALQEAMGSKGWADLQNAVDAELDEPLHDTDDEPPQGVPAEMMGGGRNHAAAVSAFKRMLPVLRHGRCANCHMNVTYFDKIAKDGGEMATHKGGDINELPMTATDRFGGQDVKFTPCKDCHTKAPPAWEVTGPDWTGLDDYQMCQEMKRAAFNGVNLLGHLREDELVKLAFQGRKAMEDGAPEPPPMTHAEFLGATKEWIVRMDAMKQWPKARSEGCPRTDAWSGSIEYTYSEVGKHTRHESHGAVHIVGGRAKWSALAARQEDHSAKNCRDVFTGSASGDGQMQLITIDYTSENPVTGITMPMRGARPGPASPAQTAFVGLTIFPGQYTVSIDLPMQGSGSNQGGGSACPGYKTHTRPFDSKIGQSAGGKFDPDNPDELSGTMTKVPFPGASVTMKWQFMRLNSEWGGR